jgi:hypothetical protein
MISDLDSMIARSEMYAVLRGPVENGEELEAAIAASYRDAWLAAEVAAGARDFRIPLELATSEQLRELSRVFARGRATGVDVRDPRQVTEAIAHGHLRGTLDQQSGGGSS